MQFGSNLEGVVASGGSKRPEPGLYVFNVLSVKDYLSARSGNRVLQLNLDIAEGKHEGFFGKYPLRYYQAYSSQEGLQRLKEVLVIFQKDNPLLLGEDELCGNSFDESKLVGLKIGAAIKHNENGYFAVHYLCSVDRVGKQDENASVSKPQQGVVEQPSSSGSDFDSMVS